MPDRPRAACAGTQSGKSARHPPAFRGAILLCFLCLTLAAAAAADVAPPFRLCADPDNLPFSDSHDDSPGFYIELGRDIAARLGRPFEPVWAPTYFGKHEIRTVLLAGHCDAIIGVPEDPNFMGPRLIYSRPILTLGYALVVPHGVAVTSLSDLAGQRVAAQFASPPQSLLANRTDLRLVTVLSPEEGMRDLAQGDADAAFIWGPSAGWINRTTMHNAYQVLPVAGPHMQWRAAIGFPRAQTAVRDEVDKALDALGDRIAALTAKYGFPVAVPIRLSAADDGVPASHEPATSSEATNAAPEPSQRSDAAPRDEAQTPGSDGDQIASGHRLFNDNCAHCHGPDAIQGERRRNLRQLQHRYGPDIDQVFLTTVTHGRVTKGMPNWSGILTDAQFRTILAFLHSVQEP